MSVILDLSKSLMYDFHYNYIKPKYEDKAQLLFTGKEVSGSYHESHATCVLVAKWEPIFTRTMKVKHVV